MIAKILTFFSRYGKYLFASQHLSQMVLKLKRVYEGYSKDDGFRVLVERLWPRGVSREEAHIDLWLKEIAPSTELRKWFSHKDERWDEFQRRYKEELRNNIALRTLKSVIADHDVVTLVFSARNEAHNNAVVLYDMLK
ncbi:MAG: DUF488 domain-containing protein [Thermoplasmatales archaeon]